ncbi:MAG: YeeE/YedE thiosulfate transporter family protein [Planctomycetaceae bacterium]
MTGGSDSSAIGPPKHAVPHPSRIEMTHLLTMKSWSPYIAGAGIGLLSWFAFATADHPIGVTTAFEYSAALVEKAAVPQLEQSNDYFAKKSAEGKPPKIDWEWMLVIGIFVGAWFSSKLSGDRGSATVPPLWRWRFGDSAFKRLAVAFGAGALMMFGARLAQGCTSGHGISGTLQLAVSSWIFITVAFAVATATAWIMYGKEGTHHV